MASNLVSESDIKEANAYIFQSSLIRRTPLLSGYVFPTSEGGALSLWLKMESLQFTGSFKIRGMTNCFRVNEQQIRENGCVTLSAGNAGRSFAFLCGKIGVTGTVCMPNTVPRDRVATIEALGSTVELVPSVELMDAVSKYTDQGRVLIHPFDDKDLIAGHASVGLEMMQDLAEHNQDLGHDDVVAVCCGGGGLVSGVAAAIKLSGCQAKVVAVEPEGCPCMHRSFVLGRAARSPEDFAMHTIAHGLAPPFAGDITYQHCQAFVDDVVLVTDAELMAATRVMYQHGFVCETSGCAAVAAAMAGKIKTSGQGNGKIVCVVTGSNISGADLVEVLDGVASVH